MKFISSAIKIFPKDHYPVVICGRRHPDCLELIWEMDIKRDKSKDVQGFIVLNDDGYKMFVDRIEGAQIAKELGYHLDYPNCLYSEDIWPE